MIAIKNLVFHNFLRYADLSISLDSLGLVLLKGINLDEPKKGSSGSGKTMFIDGVHWLFAGRTGRGISSDKVIGEADSWASVSADLEINGRAVHISRYRRHPQYENSFVVLDGQDSTRHTLDQTEDRFYEILGCSFKLMRVSCFYDSDPKFHFSRMDTGTRGELFDNIVGTEQAKIQERYRQVNDILREVQESVLSARNIVLVTSGKIESETSFIAASTDLGRQLLESYKARLASLKSKKIDVPDLSVMEARCRELETAVAAMAEQRKAHDQEAARLNELRLELTRDELRLSRLTERHQAITVKPGERCGNCGMVVTADGPAYLRDTHEQEKQQIEQQRRDFLNHIEAVKAEISNAPKTTLLDDSGLRESLYEAKSGYNLAKADATRAANIEHEIAAVTAECRTKITEFSASVAARKKDLADLHERLKLTSVELTALEARESRLSVISGFYGPSGLRPMVIGQYGPYFASVANDYLAVFTGGSEKIVLSSKKKLTSGEIRDKIEIMVAQGDDLRAFPSEFCAGETGAIDLSLNFAMMSVAAQKAGKTFGFMYFDEITNGLSGLLVEQLFDLLKTRFYHKGMTMILTTHREVPEQHFDAIWTAVKENGKCSLKL